MYIKTDYILMALHLLAWIIFVGLGIEAGALITQMVVTLTQTPDVANRVWKIVDLAALHRNHPTHFVTLSTLIIIATVLKAIMFYVIVKLFMGKHLNLLKPYNETTQKFVGNLGYLSLGIGFFTSWGARFTGQLKKDGISLPDLSILKLEGGDVWLFMGVILLIIAFIFKKGVELQNENDLTI